MAKTILLFSEGLDSILAGLLLKKQGIEICAVKFITPFFGWELKENPEKFFKKIKDLGFEEGKLYDITQEFLEVLKTPKFGYGSFANPCIDCRILMLKKAKELMGEVGAEIITTGEVAGQRPKTQHRNTLDLIEKETKLKGFLLRPLSAKLLSPTEPEKKGIVKREELLAIKGRKRTPQIELAKNFGLKEIPSSSGGCLLADPQIGSRVLKVLKEKRPLNLETAQLLTLGRHFFEDGLWIVLGRNQRENELIKNISSNRFPLYSLDTPSPTAVVLEGNPPLSWIKKLLVKYSKKAKIKLEKGEDVNLIELSNKNEKD